MMEQNLFVLCSRCQTSTHQRKLKFLPPNNHLCDKCYVERLFIDLLSYNDLPVELTVEELNECLESEESIRKGIKVYYDDLIETYYGEYAPQLTEVQEGK